jgi:predicted acetyltransferase
MDYRPLDPDDARFLRFVHDAFSPQSGPDLPDSDELPENIFAPRGLFDGEELVTVCAHYPLQMNLRGVTEPVTAISAVATPPEFRRRGHVRRILTDLAEEGRGEGIGFSALWPFKYAFYRKLGWVAGSRFHTYELPPAQLRGLDIEPAGQWERAEADDWAALQAVTRAHTGDRTLYVERTEEWWRHDVFESWGTDPYVFLWRDDAGEPSAYVVYRVSKIGEGRDRELSALDVAARDHAATEQVLDFLGNHDSQVVSVEFHLPDDIDLLDRVEDPRAVTYRVKPGPMVRVEDPTAIARLPLGPVSDRLVFAVEDPLGVAAGTYALTVDDGRATCEPSDEAPDLTIEVGALSQLVVGYRRATDLVRAGDLDASTDLAARLDALFPPERTYLREGF